MTHMQHVYATYGTDRVDTIMLRDESSMMIRSALPSTGVQARQISFPSSAGPDGSAVGARTDDEKMVQQVDFVVTPCNA